EGSPRVRDEDLRQADQGNRHHRRVSRRSEAPMQLRSAVGSLRGQPALPVANTFQPLSATQGIDMRRPNIVLFMADQMSALALRAYGNPTTLTPHLDALCEQGVTFRNAYCNFPICAPSRYTMNTGRLPHAIDAF